MYLLYDYPCNSSVECTPIHIDLLPGYYFFELWGAQGGTGCTDEKIISNFYGGRGAYVSGKMKILEETSLYLFIGGKGSDVIDCKTKSQALGGYNGGGLGGWDNDDDNSGAGGGATDIRLSKNDITSRIIVAAGGSGSAYNSFGAPGGDITGYKTIAYSSRSFEPSNTNQTAGHSLGKGADSKFYGYTPESGGGGGYYGGNLGNSTMSIPHLGTTYGTVSSSGSSYISGHPLCDSVDSSGKNTGNPIHYSNLYFEEPVIMNGNTNFRDPYGKYEIGHIGNGAIRISTLESYYKLKIRQVTIYDPNCEIFNFRNLIIVHVIISM